jgi:thiosulfate/3-mercaptopyruvate sulfurtransferase
MLEDTAYVHPELLVEAHWLQEHLDDPNLRIIDTASVDAYERAHIPGAVSLRVDNYLKDPLDSTYVMTSEQCSSLMAELGINQDSYVIAYDHRGSLYATRFWWVMSYYGHNNVAVLNGGWNKWINANFPITREVPSVAMGTFRPDTHPDLICSLDHLRSGMHSPEIVVLDVRSHKEYTGEGKRNNIRGGHIPGAVHLEWTRNLLSDDTFKPAQELLDMYSMAGVTPEKEVIVH